MRTSKRVFLDYRPRECDTFAEYLHEQSLNGWHFKEWRFGLVFKKGEPKDIVYDIEISPKASEYDMRPSEDTKDLAEYCEAAGWKLLDSHGKLCVFQKLREDARPIVSTEERFENIAKEEKDNWFRTYLTAVGLSILYLFEFIVLAFDQWAFDNTMLVLIFTIIIMGIAGLIEGVNLNLWTRKQRARLKEGKEIVYHRHGISVSRGRILFVVVLIFLVINIIMKNNVQQMIPLIILFAGIGVIAFVVSWWKPLGEQRQIFETGGIFLLAFAILVGIFSGVFFETEKSEMELHQSILGSYVVGKGTYSGNDYTFTEIEYEIYMSPHSWVIEKIWKDENRKMKEYETVVMEQDELVNQAWGAEEGYAWGMDGDYMYYMKYPNGLIDIYVRGNKREIQDGIDVLKDFLQEKYPELDQML